MADILWLVNNLKNESSYFRTITNDIRELHGILHGITSDRVINEAEIKGLYQWIQDREHLKSTYPYTEIESLIVSTLRDNRIDEREHAELMAYFESFVAYSMSKRIEDHGGSLFNVQELSRTGICAIDPEIVFEDRLFVCTGQSDKTLRSEIQKLVVSRNGLFENAVTRKTHYLVVGNAGNDAWAFNCYGRKVEQAMKMRREGKGTGILIVNEVDFWDAIG